MPNMTFMLHIGLPSLPIPSFRSWFQVLPSQLDSWPRNQLYWGKSQLWPIDSQTSWNLIHINIMNSYGPFDQVWITIPQEIWSDHQKGKMVIFRVLTAQRQFLTVWPSQWQTKITYGLKDSMTWSWHIQQVQKIPNAQDWQMNFPINWSIFDCILKSQTLTFWSKSSVKIHFSLKTCQIMKLVHQEIKNCKLGFEMKNFYNLEFF